MHLIQLFAMFPLDRIDSHQAESVRNNVCAGDPTIGNRLRPKIHLHIWHLIRRLFDVHPNHRMVNDTHRYQYAWFLLFSLTTKERCLAVHNDISILVKPTFFASIFRFRLGQHASSQQAIDRHIYSFAWRQIVYVLIWYARRSHTCKWPVPNLNYAMAMELEFGVDSVVRVRIRITYEWEHNGRQYDIYGRLLLLGYGNVHKLTRAHVNVWHTSLYLAFVKRPRNCAKYHGSVRLLHEMWTARDSMPENDERQTALENDKQRR